MQFQGNCSAASSCALSFLLSSLGGITHLVYLQMSRFSSFPQFWLLRCSWERWVILLQYGCMSLHDVGDISAVILSCWILYICAWGPDRDFAPLRKDYTPSSLRFLGSCLHYSLRTLSLHPITTQIHGICAFLF